jgi:non-homologous end joining protein Ku
MRAIWKGYLKLSLVTMPVKRYPATSKKPLKFHLYSDQGGSRRGAVSYQEQTPRVHFRAAFIRLVR